MSKSLAKMYGHIEYSTKLSSKILIPKIQPELYSYIGGICNNFKSYPIKIDGFAKFHWQDGYGAFSVSPSQINIVSDYISKQVEHNSKVSFQDEYRAFLKKYKMDYDERYVWD